MNLSELHTMKTRGHIGLHLQRFEILVKALPSVIGDHRFKAHLAQQLSSILRPVKNKSR